MYYRFRKEKHANNYFLIYVSPIDFGNKSNVSFKT